MFILEPITLAKDMARVVSQSPPFGKCFLSEEEGEESSKDSLLLHL